MANAQGYGIKLIVSFHSYNALSGNSDFYGKYYGMSIGAILPRMMHR